MPREMIGVGFNKDKRWVGLGIALHNRDGDSHMKEAMKNPWIEICPGIRRQTLVHGRTMYQMIAHLDAGSRMPEHKHAQEQIAHILSGRMKLFVDGVPHELAAGDSFYLASNVPHGVETMEETRVLDTFSPPRDEYLAKDEQARSGN